jgi:hypothetical protein
MFPLNLATLASALLLAGACTVKVEQYVIPDEMKPGWVVIDSNRPECPSQGAGPIQQIRVPPSGYICTSSPLYVGLAWHRYVSANKQGHLRSIDPSFIHQEISIRGRRSSFERCDYDADAFYYGPPGTVSGSPVNVLISNRTDCRPTGSHVATPNK